jgi:hypothetical protein
MQLKPEDGSLLISRKLLLSSLPPFHDFGRVMKRHEDTVTRAEGIRRIEKETGFL